MKAQDLEIWNGIVEREVEGLGDAGLAEVEKLALRLGGMSDEELYDRFNVPAHAQCTLCFNESQRRDPDTGSEHRGASIYARAHRDLMREHGYS